MFAVSSLSWSPWSGHCDKQDLVSPHSLIAERPGSSTAHVEPAWEESQAVRTGPVATVFARSIQKRLRPAQSKSIYQVYEDVGEDFAPPLDRQWAASSDGLAGGTEKELQIGVRCSHLPSPCTELDACAIA